MSPKEEAEYFEIIQEKNFAQKFDEYLKKYDRLSDVHASIDWTIGRDPKQGTELSEKGFYVFETMSIGSTPSFFVLYKYDPEEGIHLLSLTDIPEED